MELLSTRIESSAGTARLVGRVQLPDGARREVYFGVAAERAPMRLEPWGSHPMLDVLWSSERQRIVFSGTESRRVDKVEALVREWPESLGWLRVCLENSGGGSNCGHCRKCARTMAALAALGALERAPLFPGPTEETWRVLSADDQSLVAEIAELAHRVSPGSAVTAAVDRALARTRRRAAARTLLENTPLVAPAFDRVRRWKRGLRHLLRGGPPEEELRVVRRLRRLRAVLRRHGALAAARWAWASRSSHASTLLFFGLTRMRTDLLPSAGGLEARLAGVRKAGYQRVARLRLARASAVRAPRLRTESPQWTGIAVRLSAPAAGS